MAYNFNLDKLSKLVEARPILWDRTVDGYRIPRLTKKAWQEVYCELVDCYHALNEQDKLEIGKAINAKWTQARDVWHKDLKRRRESKRGEETEPEPLPGSKEATRYERLKFLLKVYCHKEDVDQSDPNLSGDFQCEESQQGEYPSGDFQQLEFSSGGYRVSTSPVDSEADTLPNFSLKIQKTPLIRVEKPIETVTIPDQNVKKENFESPEMIRNKHKLDYIYRHKAKKLKRENYVKSEMKTSPYNKSSIGRHGSEVKPSTSRSYKEAEPVIRHDVVEQLVRPVNTQEDQPTSSYNEHIENHSTENNSTATMTRGVWGNDKMSNFLQTIHMNELQSFDDYQSLTFQSALIDLIKKIKYSKRE